LADRDWIEIVPILVVLVVVIVALAVIPNCLDNSNCTQLSVSSKVDLDKLSEELSIEEFMADLKVMRDEIDEETLIAKNFTAIETVIENQTAVEQHPKDPNFRGIYTSAGLCF